MDSREIVALVVGGAVHAYLLTGEGENPTDNFVIGAAGGALGGMMMTYYFPQWGNLAAALSGTLGMVAFDYFLFGM